MYRVASWTYLDDLELTGGGTVNTAEDARMVETAKTCWKPSIGTAGLNLVEKFLCLLLLW